LKKFPTGPAFTKDPLKNKSGITSNNIKGFIFIVDNSMNRLVCLGWISKPERKDNFSFETRVAPLRTRPKLQPRYLTLSPMRLSHNGNLEIMLTHNETRAETYFRTVRSSSQATAQMERSIHDRNFLGPSRLDPRRGFGICRKGVEIKVFRKSCFPSHYESH
jgi:hypothetical protein